MYPTFLKTPCTWMCWKPRRREITRPVIHKNRRCHVSSWKVHFWCFYGKGREHEQGVVASYVVLPTSGPPGTCMCCPFSVIINCEGRGRGRWLLFPFLKLFWCFFGGSSCVSQIDIFMRCSQHLLGTSKRHRHYWFLNFFLSHPRTL